MEILPEIFDSAGCGPNRRQARKIIAETLRHAGLNKDARQLITVSLAFVAPAEIRRLNRQHRGIDKVTDVLSFANFSSRKSFLACRESELFIGELVLCCAYIGKSAKMHKVDEMREMAFVISHGILHLLGWRHGKPMFGVQDRVMEALANK